jgi:HSP20 family protein
VTNFRLAAPVFGVRREIDRMFDDAIRGMTTTNGWTPPVDVRETKSALVFEADVPGLTAKDIEVQTEHNLLTIRGTRNAVREAESNARVHVVERNVGGFTRTFQLPEGYDVAKIEAVCADGVLTIRLPKAASALPRVIEVKPASTQVAAGASPA